MSHLMALIFPSLLLCGGGEAGVRARQETARYDSYRGLIMTGYQGWFNTPDDGANKKWTHYSRRGKFEPGACTIDFWPDTSEYKVKYPTPFKYKDGSTAYVFSSHDESTVDLHFKWMKEYGIDGAFMQRFIHRLHEPKIKNHYRVVFDHAMKAARKHARAITIRYDLTGTKGGYSKVVLDDLDENIEKYGILTRSRCPTFLYHNRRPLIAFGGIGFAEDVAGENDVGYLQESTALVRGFKKRGFRIMVRVPACWRDFAGKALVRDPEHRRLFHQIIKECDILMPWHVGAYREKSYLRSWPKRIKEDILWCKENGIDYVPVVYPGFSRANLKDGEDGSFRPRKKGAFYWMQVSHALEAGAKMLFLAQFDEMDEGTQFFKCAKEVPVGASPFIGYEEGIESDHYLWLAGESGRMLRKERPFTKELPRRP